MLFDVMFLSNSTMSQPLNKCPVYSVTEYRSTLGHFQTTLETSYITDTFTFDTDYRMLGAHTD